MKHFTWSVDVQINIATNGNLHVAWHVSWCTEHLPKPLFSASKPSTCFTCTLTQHFLHTIYPEVDQLLCGGLDTRYLAILCDLGLAH